MAFKFNPFTKKFDYYPKLDDCATPDDNTDLDVSTSKHGLLLKLGGGTSNFLRADGTWNAPAGAAHTHDTDTLQLDGINSDGGAFAFTTSGAVTFSQDILVDGGQIGISGDINLISMSVGVLVIDGSLSLKYGTGVNEFSTDDTLAGNSDDAVPTEQAVKAYVDSQVGDFAKIKTGTYTGDGTTGQAITGVGFQPKWVTIYTHVSSEFSVSGGWGIAHWKIDQGWGDYNLQDAGTDIYARDNRINSLDADGFTVDDDGVNLDPNVDGRVYDYICLG